MCDVDFVGCNSLVLSGSIQHKSLEESACTWIEKHTFSVNYH